MSGASVLRPAPTGLKPALIAWGLAQAPRVFGLLRRVQVIPYLRGTVVATLHDDVREVFLDDATFGVPYRDRLDVITGGQAFFLGLGDGVEYRRQTGALRRVVQPADIPTLATAVEAQSEGIIAASGGRVEVVDELVRTITFNVFGAYLGITDPPGGSLRVWGTRLFEFLFADPTNDPALRAEVDVIAPALRDHIQFLIEASRVSGASNDCVLGRCVAAQAAGDPDFSDDLIRTGLMGLVVGGPPQPPMVVPQVLEQLLRRDDALAGAQAAARANNDDLLAGYVFEAMRFDPLGPALPRVALRDCVLAGGTRRARKIRQGSTVLVAFSSAMFDASRVPDPQRFNPHRLPHEYIHFGHGLHTCFGQHINRALLPLLLKPLLRRPRLRRAPGSEGHLSKRGLFADRLVVEFD